MLREVSGTVPVSKGVTFFETAADYGAHPFIAEAVRQVGRDNVVVLTKTEAQSASAMQADLDKFRRDLGVDMIDMVLLHNKQIEEDGRVERLLRSALDMILSKDFIVSNYRRFNGGDSNEALKNFADEMVSFCNVHPDYSAVVCRLLVAQFKDINLMTREVSFFATQAKSAAEFVDCVNSSELEFKRHGWLGGRGGQPVDAALVAEDLVLLEKTACHKTAKGSLNCGGSGVF